MDFGLFVIALEVLKISEYQTHVGSFLLYFRNPKNDAKDQNQS